MLSLPQLYPYLAILFQLFIIFNVNHFHIQANTRSAPCPFLAVISSDKLLMFSFEYWWSSAFFSLDICILHNFHFLILLRFSLLHFFWIFSTSIVNFVKLILFENNFFNSSSLISKVDQMLLQIGMLAFMGYQLWKRFNN